MMRTYLKYILLSAVWIPLLVSLYLLGSRTDYEPFFTACALLVTAITIYADHWLREKERRREVLAAVMHELYGNAHVIRNLLVTRNPNAPFAFFQRLSISALSSALASGIFTTKRDAQLTRLAYDLYQRLGDLNHALDVTEIASISVASASTNREQVTALCGHIAKSPIYVAADTALKRLGAHLLDRYSRESGISKETMMFAGEEDQVAN